jgi:hypothetical protein
VRDGFAQLQVEEIRKLRSHAAARHHETSHGLATTWYSTRLQ